MNALIRMTMAQASVRRQVVRTSTIVMSQGRVEVGYLLSSSFPSTAQRSSTTASSALLASEHKLSTSLQHIRSFSSYHGNGGNPGNSGGTRMNPAYQVYGEESALTIKAIIPGFKTYGKSIVQDKSRKGRLLFEWTPRNSQGGFAWDSPQRFAITAEEAGLVVARAAQSLPAEFARRPTGQMMSVAAETTEKIMKVIPQQDGSAVMEVTHESTDKSADFMPDMDQLGPLSIHLTAGEFQVILSILEYSIPRLTGWSIMFEHAMESSVNQQERSGQPQSDNYQGGGKGGFFDSHDVPF